MGDRAWVGFTVYAVADEDIPALFAFMDNHFAGWPDRVLDEIVLGEQYTIDEQSLSWCQDEVRGLIERAPSLVIDTCQSNCYEYPGEQLYYSPEGGLFIGDTDGQGEVMLHLRDVDRALEELSRGGGAPATAKELRDLLAAETGEPQAEAVMKVAAPAILDWAMPGTSYRRHCDSLPRIQRPKEDS